MRAQRGEGASRARKMAWRDGDSVEAGGKAHRLRTAASQALAHTAWRASAAPLCTPLVKGRFDLRVHCVVNVVVLQRG